MVLGAGTDAYAGPLKDALEQELAAVRDARDLLRGAAALERERESLRWASTVLDHRSRESLRRLDAYRVSREARGDQARGRARAMYKLARGGMLRLYFEDVAARGEDASTSKTAERVARGRTVRWLVRHDLRELAVHTRAENRARAELLSATRELAAISSLQMVHEMERGALAEATAALDPQLLAAKRSRRRAQRRASPDASERKLLRAIVVDRAALDRARGLDLLEPAALRRPVRGTIVGKFGTYDDPVLRLPMERNGIELRAARRERVRSVASGTVALVGSLPGFDEVVVVDHGNGYVSLTARLQDIQVEEGQELERGAQIGRVAPKGVDDGLGRTVYFELRHGERPVDPTEYLSRTPSKKPGVGPAVTSSDG